MSDTLIVVNEIITAQCNVFDKLVLGCSINKIEFKIRRPGELKLDQGLFIGDWSSTPWVSTGDWIVDAIKIVSDEDLWINTDFETPAVVLTRLSDNVRQPHNTTLVCIDKYLARLNIMLLREVSKINNSKEQYPEIYKALGENL